jgi:hypothetical protein
MGSMTGITAVYSFYTPIGHTQYRRPCETAKSVYIADVNNMSKTMRFRGAQRYLKFWLD